MTEILDLSVKGDSPPAPCEARVEIKLSQRARADWVRIPVTQVEQWNSKDGPSDLNRTAKVKFPGEWGGRSIVQYINGFSAVEEDAAGDSTITDLGFDEARIYFQDEDTGNYQISHYGFVGGVGAAAENGVFKLWVYDPADLLRRIRVSKSFGQPTIQQVINFVLRGTDDNGRDVGLEHRSPFDNIGTYIAGIQEVKAQKVLEERREEDIADTIDDSFEFVIESALNIVGPFQINIDSVVGDIFDWAKDNLIDPQLTGQRRFQLNRHNMLDLMDWFASEIGGKWHFEPTPQGPLLFFDNTASRGVEETLTGARQRADGEISRRRFVDQTLVVEDFNDVRDAQIASLGDISVYRDMQAFDIVTTLENEALYDIKPFNALTLYGETHDPSAYNRQELRKAAREAPPSAPIMSSRFPKVELTYQPLIDRAGGYEYEAPAIESDKVDLQQAKQEAIKEFRSYLEEETEGSITIKGNPYIAPYDYVTTIPACGGVFPNIGASPITYEVHSAKHTRSAGDHYKTKLGVSLVLDETQLDVEAKYVDA